MAGVALDYGIQEERKGLPLSYGITVEETKDDQGRTGGVDLSYGIGESTGTNRTETGVDLSYGIKGKGVDLSHGLESAPSNRFEKYKNPQPASFGAKHPNLYGLWGAAKETGKSLIPYLQYVDPDERERFLKLSQQHQTRELLLETLNTVLLGALKPIGQGVKAVAKPAMQKFLPKTFARLTKPIGKTSEVVTADGLAKVPTEKASLEGYAKSVNLSKQSIPEEMKLMELRAAESSAPKTKVAWSETDTASKVILADENKIQLVMEKAKAGLGLNAAETDAIRKANVEGLFKFQERIKVATTPEQVNAIQDAYRMNLFEPVSNAASEAGRTLNIYKREIGLNRIGKAFGKLERGLNKRELDAFKNLNMDNPAEIKTFVDGLGNPKLMDYVYEYWYNQILSGIPTHVVNITSNTAWRAFQVPHRALTGAVDKMVTTFTGAQRTRYMNETLPLMAGFLKGKGKAAKSAWQVARHGRLQAFEDKWAKEIGGVLGAFDRSPSKVVRGVGKALTVPTRGLRAVDTYANSLAYDGQLNALARRASNLKGLKGAARKEFERKFITNPTDKAHKEAMEFAKYTTFMSDPGWLSSGIMKMRGKTPGGRFLVPFVNTIGNLLKRGIEMTPGVGLTLARGQNPSEVIAKQIEGAIISLYMLHKCDEGKITGALPQNKNERDAFFRQGKKPWAIKVGDNWVEYRRAEPYNTVLASTAIAYDRIKNARDEETATEIFLNMSNDLKNNLIDSSYLQGVTKILNRHGSAKGLLPRLGASFVPYSSFFRSINRSYEAATEGTVKLREGSEWLQAFSQVIPGMPKELPARMNVWGEDIELQGGMFRQWLPYRWSKETTDVTELSLEKLEVYPGLPGKTFTYKKEKHEFDEDIYRNYSLMYGKRAKEYLDTKFSQPLWQRAMKDPKQHDKIRSKVDSILTKLRNRERRRAVVEQRRRWQEQ